MRKRVRRPVPPAEHELASAWERAPAAGTLRTQDGGALAVRYPGRRNGGPGPDFLDAILVTERGEVRGAVEVHRRSSDWARHGHGADARYAGVVLHVVGRDDGARAGPPGAVQLPLLEIGPHPASWPASRTDGTGAAAEGSPVPFPCARATRAGHDHSPALVAAGLARFATETTRWRAVLDAGGEAEQQAYEAVAGALGFERNTAPMRDLARAVPLASLRALARRRDAAMRLEAVLLGSAGLLPSQRHLPAVRRGGVEVARRERAWLRSGQPTALRAYRWEWAAVRPENGPVRRVVALAHLALRWPAGGLVGEVRRALDGPGDLQDHPAALRRLASLVTVAPVQGYWSGQWDFGLPAGPTADSGPGALVGASRAADVVVNVLLPLAAAGGQGAGARGALLAHPALAENWITRLVRQRSETGKTRGGAVAQQGYIAVFEQACRDLRCDVCPLGGGVTTAFGAAAP